MAKSYQLTHPIAGLREMQVSDNLDKFSSAYDDLRDAWIDGSPKKARAGLEKIKDVDVGAFANSLESPAATELEIHASVGMLIAVTKHLDKVDGPVFQDMLVHFIMNEQPTRIGLALAMRKVILSSRFTPSIAEVIDALKRAESDIRSSKVRLQSLQEKIQSSERLVGLGGPA